MINPLRGELYWIDWNPARGSEQAGRRPGLVISTDAANTNPRFPNVIVAAVSTKGRSVPTHVLIRKENAAGLSADSYVKCEQLLTISKERLLTHICGLSEQLMEKVGQAVLKALELG